MVSFNLSNSFMEVSVSNDCQSYQQIRMLLTLQRSSLEKKSKEELLDLVSLLSTELLAFRDMTYGPNRTAEFFNRSRSWVYEAMSRPSTELQRGLARIAARERGGLLFQVSDLVRLRKKLFRREETGLDA